MSTKTSAFLGALLMSACAFACSAPTVEESGAPIVLEDVRAQGAQTITVQGENGTVSVEGRTCNCPWGNPVAPWGTSCIAVCEAGPPAGGGGDTGGGDTGGGDTGGDVDPDPCAATLCLQNGHCVICEGG